MLAHIVNEYKLGSACQLNFKILLPAPLAKNVASWDQARGLGSGWQISVILVNLNKDISILKVCSTAKTHS